MPTPCIGRYDTRLLCCTQLCTIGWGTYSHEESVGVDQDLEDREDVKDGSGAYERTELMHEANESKRLKYFQ